MCQIDINGVKITLTKEQLAEIAKQTSNNKSITEKVYDLDSLCKELKTTPKKLLPYQNTTDKTELAVNAFIILSKVAELYNEGNILDWRNTNIYKYIPYKYFSSCSYSVYFNGWSYFCYGSGLLFYKSESLAKISYNNFKEYWESYWNIS